MDSQQRVILELGDYVGVGWKAIIISA